MSVVSFISRWLSELLVLEREGLILGKIKHCYHFFPFTNLVVGPSTGVADHFLYLSQGLKVINELCIKYAFNLTVFLIVHGKLFVTNELMFTNTT